MKMDFTGRVVIITGAGKGIGRETARRFAETGAKLVLVGHREESISQTKAEIEEIAKDVITIRANVEKWDEIQAMARSVMAEFGRIDILVNNAGIDMDYVNGRSPNIFEVSDQDFDRIVQVNLKGQFNCAKAVLPYMMEAKYGRVINTSSSVGVRGHTGSIVYCATKAGIIAQTKVLAREFGAWNICVNCVAPGLVISPFHKNTPVETLEKQASEVPLGRPGYPKDIAHAVLFFASDELFCTGQTLIVDGGKTML
jgi:3-oxoacyl-[acyl-carrier protein] reductase